MGEAFSSWHAFGVAGFIGGISSRSSRSEHFGQSKDTATTIPDSMPQSKPSGIRSLLQRGQYASGLPETGGDRER